MKFFIQAMQCNSEIQCHSKFVTVSTLHAGHVYLVRPSSNLTHELNLRLGLSIPEIIIHKTMIIISMNHVDNCLFFFRLQTSMLASKNNTTRRMGIIACSFFACKPACWQAEQPQFFILKPLFKNLKRKNPIAMTVLRTQSNSMTILCLQSNANASSKCSPTRLSAFPGPMVP